MSGAHQQTPANGIIKARTLAELEGIYAPLCSSARLGWKDFHLERYFVNRIPTTNNYFERHLICIPLAGEFKADESAVGGGRRTTVYRQGAAHLLAKSERFVGHSVKKVDLLQIGFEHRFLAEVAADLMIGERVEIKPQLKLEDAFINDAAKHLLAEVESGGATGTLYVESLMTALAARLIKNYSTARILPLDYKGGLAKHKLRITVEFINEHLSENISLETLAALCGLSLFHFARAFKQSTGFAPHQFVIKQRIERAKRLLRETDLQIVEICLRVGFESQNHFTTLFRRHTGATPKIYRDRS